MLLYNTQQTEIWKTKIFKYPVKERKKERKKEYRKKRKEKKNSRLDDVRVRTKGGAGFGRGQFLWAR